MDNNYFYTNLFKYAFAILCWPIGYAVLSFSLGEVQFEILESIYQPVDDFVETRTPIEETKYQKKILKLKHKNEAIFKEFIKTLKENYKNYEITISHDKQKYQINMFHDTPLIKTKASIFFTKNADGYLNLTHHEPMLTRKYHWLTTPFLMINNSWHEKFYDDYDLLKSYFP